MQRCWMMEEVNFKHLKVAHHAKKVVLVAAQPAVQLCAMSTTAPPLALQLLQLPHQQPAQAKQRDAEILNSHEEPTSAPA